SCVVVPHYDNAEGGTHDTRFCYMGERRLAVMETMLPDDAWVLGIDEHTVLIVDLDARTVAISGRGSLTVRRRGPSPIFAPGQKRRRDALLAAARGDTAHTRASEPAVVAAGAPAEEKAPAQRSPLLAEVARLEQAFEAAIAGRKASEAAEAILNLAGAIAEWSAHTLQTDAPDRARAILYSLVQRLGEAAAGGLRDPRELLAPLVENLITLRGEMRRARVFVVARRGRRAALP